MSQLQNLRVALNLSEQLDEALLLLWRAEFEDRDARDQYDRLRQQLEGIISVLESRTRRAESDAALAWRQNASTDNAS